jgi:LPS-assembly protein
MSRFVLGPIVVLVAITWALPAAAQVNVAGYNIAALRQERLGEHHGFLTGAVELEQGDTKLYADEVEVFENEDRVIARGNVVLSQGNNRIAADRADFNTKTRLGTFYRASGIATIQPPRQAPQPGIVVPQIAGQDTDVYFFGETVEKLGPEKYKITNGGFSTCVQPTPRWDLAADTVILNVDHYTLLRQALLKVKGVPLLYLPILYYPTKEDGRATGFLIPTYGVSSIRGQSLHNAFFWAIGRSHDATLLHDWFSKTGTGTGAEYRYNLGGGSSGELTAYTLDQRAATYSLPNGTTSTQPALRSYTVNGGLNQALPRGLQARGRVSYFSSITTNQTFNTNVYDAGRNNRSYGANVVGAWSGFTLNGTFERNEWFTSTTNSGVTGSSPRISLTRTERPLFANAPVYFSATSEIAHLDRLTKGASGTTDDRSLGRVDFAPLIRYPFKKWQWFTVNSTLSWRNTFYTRSLDLQTKKPIEDRLNRQYFTVAAQASGPVFMKVWDTPGSDYAERFKHTIEPFFNVRRTSAIDNFDRIVQIDGTDTILGRTTSISYGLNNRIYAKRKLGAQRQAQEVLAVELTQSYYTDARASQYDPRYNTSFSTNVPNKFSPIALAVRATPSADINGTMRLEIDSRYYQFRTIAANANYTLARHVSTTVGWSHKFFIRELPGFNDRNSLDHYLNLASTVHTADNRYGGIYSFNYDVLRSRMLQQRFSSFYNAQCCGIAFEYQRYNFSGVPSAALPSDHRFFLSFSLAGLGNFSPFNGALGGVPR